MNIAPLKLAKFSYLLDPTPRPTFLYAWPILIFVILLFLGSFYVTKKNSGKGAWESLRGLAPRMREFSLIGFILLFFRSENIPYLGLRLWLLLWGLSLLAYLIYLALIWKKEKEERENEALILASGPQRKDYLPKAKRQRKKRK